MNALHVKRKREREREQLKMKWNMRHIYTRMGVLVVILMGIKTE